MSLKEKVKDVLIHDVFEFIKHHCVAFHQNSPGRPEIVKAVLVNYDLYQQVLYFDENDSINNQHKIDTDFKLGMRHYVFWIDS